MFEPLDVIETPLRDLPRMGPEPLYTREQLWECFQLSVASVRAGISSGQITIVQTPSSNTMYRITQERYDYYLLKE